MRGKITAVLLGAALAFGAAVSSPAGPAEAAAQTLVCSSTTWCTADASARSWPLYYSGIEVATATVTVERKWVGSQLYFRAYTHVHNNCWTTGCGPGGLYFTKSVQAGSTDTSDRVRLGCTIAGSPALQYAVPVNADAGAGEGLDAITWSPAEAVDVNSGAGAEAGFTTGQASARLLSGQLVTLHTRSYDTAYAYRFYPWS